MFLLDLLQVVGQDLPLNTMFSDVAEVTTWKGMQIPGLILLRDSYAPSHGLDTNLYSVALVTGYEGSVGRAHDKSKCVLAQGKRHARCWPS